MGSRMGPTLWCELADQGRTRLHSRSIAARCGIRTPSVAGASFSRSPVINEDSFAFAQCWASQRPVHEDPESASVDGAITARDFVSLASSAESRASELATWPPHKATGRRPAGNTCIIVTMEGSRDPFFARAATGARLMGWSALAIRI